MSDWTRDENRNWAEGNGDREHAAELACDLADTRAELTRLREVNRGLHDALFKVRGLSRPGQQLNIPQAIDVICDIWNAADAALNAAKETGQ